MSIHIARPRVNAAEAAEFTCVMSAATATTVDQQKQEAGNHQASTDGVLTLRTTTTVMKKHAS
jgi:hypothetical protein